MPFGMWARVGPCNHVLDGGLDPQERSNFGVGNRPHLALLAMRNVANSADHNHRLMRLFATDGVAGPCVCACIPNPWIILQKRLN